MRESELEVLVTQLREEVAKAKKGAPDAFAQLEPLLTELDHALHAPAPGLRERVETQIREFEVEHPRLTGILNDVMTSLGNLGI
ncbi:MAG: DUF4404 family protein [Gammaproteobacteria bacterium]|nr:DUF4404 family protein [Gammaproteobacteria bacterium]